MIIPPGLQPQRIARAALAAPLFIRNLIRSAYPWHNRVV